MERGFIQGKLEIKLLILYILARGEEALDMDTLTDVAMCDSGVSYFDFTSALAELVQSLHVERRGNLFYITEQGRENGGIMEDQLPYSVKMRCDVKLTEINERFREAKRVHAEMIRLDDGSWRVSLALDGEEENLFSLSLTLPLQEDAKKLIQRFKADPQKFLRQLREI